MQKDLYAVGATGFVRDRDHYVEGVEGPTRVALMVRQRQRANEGCVDGRGLRNSNRVRWSGARVRRTAWMQ